MKKRLSMVVLPTIITLPTILVSAATVNTDKVNIMDNNSIIIERRDIPEELTFEGSFAMMMKEYKSKYAEFLVKQEEERIRKEEEKRLEEERKLAEEENRIRISNVNYHDYNVTIKSNITIDEMYNVLCKKANGAMAHLANAFVDAEEIYGINAFFLAGLAALEGDWSRSNRSRKDNNLTGMAVYSDGSPGTYYPSQYDCILDTARQLKKYYLSPNGTYFSGYSSSDIETHYCEKKDWNEKIDTIAYDLVDHFNLLYR